MSTSTARHRTAVVVLAAASALTACSGDPGVTAPAASAPASASTTTPAHTTDPAPATTSPAAVTAAPAPADGVPEGAGTARTVDLDGDGAPDTLWLADVDGERRLGVVTTSHGTTSVAFTSAAPQTATASAAVLATGAPTVFLNTGRSVQLYVYRQEDAALLPVPGQDGEQYSFSLGFTPYGTGLTCERAGDGLHLYGVDADEDGGSWSVTRTEVVVDANRVHARNGEVETVVSGVGADHPAVTGAHGTTCGDVPASAVAAEPHP
ncbi:hypothetical protein [Kineococcus sp. SYSU DK018]|uniref:hypothetical protein n=1 Tax=Kineococcus sp. SYSU DK018 TaxID=3383139 RepID=UPI003D7E9AFC